MIKWTASKFESEIINRIADRAVSMAEKLGVNYEKMTAYMDIEACHCNGMPLDLARLEAADDGNFGHDVFGIRRHINRSTGQIENCFVPRFALPEAKESGVAA